MKPTSGRTHGFRAFLKRSYTTDEGVVLYLALATPLFLLLLVCIVLFAAVAKKLEFGEAFEIVQLCGPVFLTYIGAILGFAFHDTKGAASNLTVSPNQPRKNPLIADAIRPMLSFLLCSGHMALTLGITLALVFDAMTFSDYKTAAAIVMWSLAGSCGFIIGRYFGQLVSTGVK